MTTTSLPLAELRATPEPWRSLLGWEPPPRWPRRKCIDCDRFVRTTDLWSPYCPTCQWTLPAWQRLVFALKPGPLLTPCHIAIGTLDEYGYVRLYENGKLQRAHRVAWEHERGPIPDGMLVLHACDRPPCVRVAHLFLGTQADNMADMDAKGRRALRTPDHVERAVVELHRRTGWSQRALGRWFGLSHHTVGRILAEVSK